MHVVDVVVVGIICRHHPAGRIERGVGEVLDLEVIGRAGAGLGDQHGQDQHRRGGPAVVVKVRIPPVGAQVRAGGFVFPTGVQRNRDGCLDRSELFGKIGRTGSAARLTALRPILNRFAGRTGSDLCQRGARTVGRHRPGILVAVGDFVHQPVVVVAQHEPFAAVGEFSRVRPQRVLEASVCLQDGGTLGNHQIPAAGDYGSFDKRELHAPIQRPAREIHIHGHLVVQLDPLHARLIVGRMVHDLVEDHRTIG